MGAGELECWAAGRQWAATDGGRRRGARQRRTICRSYTIQQTAQATSHLLQLRQDDDGTRPSRRNQVLLNQAGHGGGGDAAQHRHTRGGGGCAGIQLLQRCCVPNAGQDLGVAWLVQAEAIVQPLL